MLNKKGLTLVEVIVSIALVSVVLAFMVKLVSDLNNAQTNSTYAKENQINRAEILRIINNDVNSKSLSNINSNGSTANNLIINLEFTDNTTSRINATDTTFRYTSTTGESRVWTMNNCEIYTSAVDIYFSKETNIYTLIVDIEIHTFNEQNERGNNNTLDDIMLSFIGDSSDFLPNTLVCLGYNC